MAGEANSTEIKLLAMSQTFRKKDKTHLNEEREMEKRGCDICKE